MTIGMRRSVTMRSAKMKSVPMKSAKMKSGCRSLKTPLSYRNTSGKTARKSNSWDLNRMKNRKMICKTVCCTFYMKKRRRNNSCFLRALMNRRIYMNVRNSCSSRLCDCPFPATF